MNVTITWHQSNRAADGLHFGQCVRHKGNHLTYMQLNGEWFCENCFVQACAAGEFSVIAGALPDQSEPRVEVEVEWT